MADKLNSLPRKWARVQARVTRGWDKEFVDNIANCLKREGWQPTERQRETMESMCRVYDADTPEYGEVFIRKDGSKIEFVGRMGAWDGGDGWCEVRE
jgi:hypothetical protein